MTTRRSEQYKLIVEMYEDFERYLELEDFWASHTNEGLEKALKELVM